MYLPANEHIGCYGRYVTQQGNPYMGYRGKYMEIYRAAAA